MEEEMQQLNAVIKDFVKGEIFSYFEFGVLFKCCCGKMV